MYPTLNAIIAAVYRKSPFQKKKLEKFLGQQSPAFLAEAEEFFRQFSDYLQEQKIEPGYAVDAYLDMCKSMMKAQMYFLKHGKYPASSAVDAYENVYSDEAGMKSYMFGLALSQFLWATHYEMFSCFKQALAGQPAGSYLEIGPGHGLFLHTAMKLLPPAARLTAVDISPVSMAITKSIVQFFHPKAGERIQYHTGDMLNFSLSEKFDFITMGEVIEHVNFPEKLLRKLHDLLAPEGRAFVSTCVNCPAVDHVYHFHAIEEIRSMLENCGLRIVEERVLPVEDLPMTEIVRRKITINYCAIISAK